LISAHFGEFSALMVAIFWSFSATAFEVSSKRAGALTVNLLRLIFAFILVSVFTYFYRGYFFPSDAPVHSWIWLSISGIIGFVIGDFCLFQAFVIIGARVSELIMSLAPVLTAMIGWMVLGERLTFMNWLGIFITLAGIALVVLDKPGMGTEKSSLLSVRLPLVGVLLAIGGALGQAAGLVLSKYGMRDYDPFAATQIRQLSAIIGFTVIYSFFGSWRKIPQVLCNKSVMMPLSLGSFFGPFLGVSFSLLAIKYTSTAIAATIMSIVPVLIIVPSVLYLKEKPRMKEIIGAFIAVGGIALFFL
jgi:drug/metabolite transporter (DMT)-like permease